MEWTITTTNRDTDVIRIDASGLASLDECERLVNELLGRGDWHADSRLLIDCRSVKIKALRFEDIDRSGMIMRDHAADFGASKIAILVTRGVGFGIGQQFKSVTEARTDIRVDVFADESDAIRWIGDGDLSASTVKVR